MLVLNRKPGKRIIIQCEGKLIEIMVLDCKIQETRIGIVCDKDVLVDREEVYLSKIETGTYTNAK